MKSPLKRKPLRNPGQSLDEHIYDFITEGFVPYVMAAVGILTLAVMEWYHWATNIPPVPVSMTVVAALVLLCTARKFVTSRKKLKALRQGRDGEKAVGQYLELLREKGAKVFHDIPGEGFNLDHVVIDKSGIYVIETKTFSKPEKGQTIVTYDGERVFVNGREPQRNPVIQVRAACQWLKELLKESTGRDCTPRPVVVFPGWYVEPTMEAKNSDVWVLNPKALPAFISHSKPQYESDDLHLFSSRLCLHVTSTNGK